MTAAGLPAVGELFESNGTTRGCWCVWFLLGTKDVTAGWGAGNRARFERMVTEAGEPAGLLARDDGGGAVGWCFFVRAGARRNGLTHHLLTAAVELAREHGATAIEGFPLAGAGPHQDDRYLGTEPLFADCGFTVIARPSARRVVMRRDLT